MLKYGWKIVEEEDIYSLKVLFYRLFVNFKEEVCLILGKFDEFYFN